MGKQNEDRNISVQQMRMMDADDYLCIDIRGEDAYQHGHIPVSYTHLRAHETSV